MTRRANVYGWGRGFNLHFTPLEDWKNLYEANHLTLTTKTRHKTKTKSHFCIYLMVQKMISLYKLTTFNTCKNHMNEGVYDRVKTI